MLLSSLFLQHSATSVRAEGKSTEAMNGVLVGTIINIILDPILILWLDYGIAGAAWATVIGNVVSTFYYIFLLTGKRSRLTLSATCFHLKKEIAGPVLAIGIPASLNCIMMNVSTISLNICLVAYGDNMVAAMGIASKVIMMVVFVQLGLGAGHTATAWLQFRCPQVGSLQGCHAFFLFDRIGNGHKLHLALRVYLQRVGRLLH